MTGKSGGSKERSAGLSVERIFLVLDRLATTKRPMTLTEISQDLKLPKSSMLKLLRKMARQGYLAEDPVKRTYFPSLRISNIGQDIEYAMLTRHWPRMMLENLRDRCGESVAVAIRHGIMTEYHCCLPGRFDLTFNLMAGLRYPLYISAAGRAILSALPDGEIDRLVGRIRKARLAEFAPLDRMPLYQDIADIRQRGYATTAPAASPNVMSIAKVLPTPQFMRPMAVTVGGPKDRILGNKDSILRDIEEAIETSLAPV